MRKDALLLGGIYSPPLGLDTTWSLHLDCPPLRYPSAQPPHLLSETHLTDCQFNPATCSVYLPILVLLHHTKYYLLMYRVIYIFIVFTVLSLLEGPWVYYTKKIKFNVSFQFEVKKKKGRKQETTLIANKLTALLWDCPQETGHRTNSNRSP